MTYDQRVDPDPDPRTILVSASLDPSLFFGTGQIAVASAPKPEIYVTRLVAYIGDSKMVVLT